MSTAGKIRAHKLDLLLGTGMLEELSTLRAMHLGAWLGAGGGLGDEFLADLGDEFVARVLARWTPCPTLRMGWWEAGAPQQEAQ